MATAVFGSAGRAALGELSGPSNLSTQLDSRRYRPGIVRLLANATVSSRFLSAQNLINLSQFSLGEIRVVQRPDILFQLGWGTRSDKSGGDDRQT